MSSASAPADTSPHANPTARWSVLIGAIIVQLILGTVYGYSIFWKPLEARLFSPPVFSKTEQAKMVGEHKALPVNAEILDDKQAKKKHDERQAGLKWAFALAILSFAVTMVFAGRVQDAKGPKIPAAIGAVLLGMGFILASLVLKAPGLDTTAVTYLLWLTIGIVAGAGIGFAYVCPIAALVKWFPEAKGLVSGIAVAGFGFGAFIFSDTKYLPIGGGSYLALHGPADFFMVHGIVSIIAVLIGAALLSNPPGTAAKAAAEFQWKDLVKNPAFPMIWIMFFSGALAGLTVIGVAKGYAGEQLVMAAGAAADKAKLMEQGAAAVGMLAIFNAIGRVAWGTVSDKIGRTRAFVAMFAFQAVMMFVLPHLTTMLSITLGAGLVGFNFGGNFALFPSATADLFGAKSIGANYGLVFTSYGLAGVAGIFAANQAKDLTGSYSVAFAICGGLCILSAILALQLHRLGKKAVAA